MLLTSFYLSWKLFTDLVVVAFCMHYSLNLLHIFDPILTILISSLPVSFTCFYMRSHDSNLSYLYLFISALMQICMILLIYVSDCIHSCVPVFASAYICLYLDLQIHLHILMSIFIYMSLKEIYMTYLLYVFICILEILLSLSS